MRSNLLRAVDKFFYHLGWWSEVIFWAVATLAMIVFTPVIINIIKE